MITLRSSSATFAKQLNRLRIMNDIRKLEREKELEQVQAQYKPPAEPTEGM
jgi:hypothetical protein